MQTTILKAGQELTPVDFRFAERDAHAQQYAMAVRGNACRDENGTRHDRAAVTNLFIAGIQHEKRNLSQRPLPPGAQFFI
jgi:hypothetical protein